MNTPFAPNTLYYGDCLDIMAGFPDSSIDLICLDPPFNSNEKYNKVFKDSGLRIDPQIKALTLLSIFATDDSQGSSTYQQKEFGYPLPKLLIVLINIWKHR